MQRVLVLQTHQHLWHLQDASQREILLLAVKLEMGKSVRSLCVSVASCECESEQKKARKKDTCALWNLRNLVLLWSRIDSVIERLEKE